MLLHDLKRRVALSPDDAEARYLLAEALFSDAQYEVAARHLEKALALVPGHKNARRLLARAYRRDGRLVPAERTLEEAVRDDPRDLMAREDLAELLVEVGRVDDALMHLEEAVSLAPDDVERRRRAADLATRQRLLPRARAHLEHAARIAPTDRDLARELDALRRAQGEVSGPPLSPLLRGSDFLLGRARSALEHPEVRPLAAGPLRAVALALRQGDLAAAKRALALCSADVPASPAFDVLGAELALALGDLARARRFFQRCIGQRPGLALAYARLGEIEEELGDATSALSRFRELVRLAPEDPDGHEALGDALCRAGRMEEALDSWQQAVARRADPILAARIAAARAAHRAVAADAHTAVIGALGYNPLGGVVSLVEALAVPGKGELVLTGNVGRSGQEASKVAHACLKSRADQLGVAPAIASHDLHIHYIDSEFAKDGPSAGLALALAGLSALSKRPLARDLAASGEITLQGAVRAVGGLHEKVVAAYLYSLKTVLLPRKSLFDARRLPTEATSRLHVIYVDSLTEALEHAFSQPQ